MLGEDRSLVLYEIIKAFFQEFYTIYTISVFQEGTWISVYNKGSYGMVLNFSLHPHFSFQAEILQKL